MPAPSSEIQDMLKAAVEEVSVADADAVDQKRGKATETVLRHVADSGAEGLPWVNGLREIFVVEVSRAATILFRVASAQASSNGPQRKSLSNTVRYEIDARLQEFAADNEFIVGELRGLTRTPFTAQRMAEVLLNPLHHHTRAPPEDLHGFPLVHDGAGAEWTKQVEQLRPDVLQNVLRKCVLVTPTGVALVGVAGDAPHRFSHHTTISGVAVGLLE
eukprot:CAMPEP_0174843450 /NCGR_PEP_ID=MMETSP1114-20130205/10536_1 /TAXON_ID=312471 /ORGANISM="Neobodo designis, Strain CCAP 1951/1" /LENGTH=216 /DNA_ID=CAMNT_0016077675 /DNA_START=41 /DNA_END=687 /DNA_ORIENTATION=+